ncbi:outer membrane protein assembly factor BamA [Gillisia sp. Hel_I_86]|uniref:translocation and assembly module lipoprotein TamL n=1 Tax=Gillisia sp. Hel_I_86 TaxID=1249981 RepID=UPI001199AB6A|nr:BamA/TamA family outer membrane protein [Gillisia sp. Hel_I_86]TVZ28387.1 outer membrane protein assembly factor BamA [Gillisia sp. Hel_I_86]
MRFRNSFLLTHTIIILSLGLVVACSAKKYVPEDKFLYTGAEVIINSEDTIQGLEELQGELEDVLRPKPNAKFLGMRPGLYYHYKAQKEKPGFITKFLNKKIGEEPVYSSRVDLSQTESLLHNRLENRGFFFSEVSSNIEEDGKAKEASATYNVRLSHPYLLKNYQLDSDSLMVYKEINSSLNKTLIKPGMRYDLSKLKLERERIEGDLKQKGYYNFSPGLLIFEADTNQYSNNRFDLFLRLKKDVPEKTIVPYKITKVNIFPNYVVDTDSIKKDTILYANKNFIQETEYFKPERLDPFILIEKDQFFNPTTSRNTSRRLATIGAYKFINIRYDEIDSLSTDSLGILEANIFLSPLNKRAIRAELQAVTKSNDFAGPNLELTYVNRNLFKGGEILKITGKFGYEFQLVKGNQSGFNSLEFGLKSDLIFPRLLFPISFSKDFFTYAIPKTRISLGADFLNRTKLFSLTSFYTSFGYFWTANKYVTHEFNPISVNLVKLTNTTPAFDDILKANPFLQTSFDQQFIAGLTYSFTYNGMVDAYKKHQFFTNLNLDIAGNTLGLLSGSKNGDKPSTFLGSEFAQYAKADVDLRYHFNFGKEQKIATRLFAGLGMPYGNSEVMPYTKQYFSGGPYSVRAFKSRSLGPGTYVPEIDEFNSYFNQTGNIRLEANVEYRFPIYSFFKGAIFADAGNVWNTKENEALPGGEFTGDFINQLGIGAGAGLRIDIQSFVIRFDLAAALKRPTDGKKFNFDYANPVLNFAIGYPF